MEVLVMFRPEMIDSIKQSYKTRKFLVGQDRADDWLFDYVQRVARNHYDPDAFDLIVDSLLHWVL